jgi:hypothetical protein
LTFHEEMKVRTVIWDFSSELIPSHLLQSLIDLRNQLNSATNSQPSLVQELVRILPPEEVDALKRRMDWVLEEGIFPGLPGRNRRRRG